MDWFLTAFNWLMVHQPPFPWSLIWGGIAFALTARFVMGLIDDDEDGIIGPVVISIFVAGFIGGIGGTTVNPGGAYYWYHWISLGLGWLGVPAILTALFVGFSMVYGSCKWVVQIIGAGVNAVVRGCKAIATRWQAWRTRKAKAAEAERQALEKAPQTVIARCREVVEDFKRRLPLDETSPAVMMRATNLLEAVSELYALKAGLDMLAPGDSSALAEKVSRADKLFADVELERECPELVASLRKERQDIEPVRRHIHVAIEALVLLIATLPDQVANKMALQTPHEYQQVVDDFRQPNGKSLLPDITSPATDTPLRPMAKRQTA